MEERGSGRFWRHCRAESCDGCPVAPPGFTSPMGWDTCQGLNSKAQLQSGRSHQMVGLPATSGESQSLTAALGEALPSWNRHKGQLLEAPCWMVGRKRIWVAGGMGTREPPGQQLLTNSFGNSSASWLYQRACLSISPGLRTFPASASLLPLSQRV